MSENSCNVQTLISTRIWKILRVNVDTKKSFWYVFVHKVQPRLNIISMKIPMSKEK